MVRRLGLLVALSVLSVMVLAGGCGKKGPAVGENDVFLYVRATADDLEVWRQLAKTFTDATKIPVVIDGANGKDYWPKLERLLSRGQAPDVALVDSTRFPELATQGKLLNLEPYLRKQREIEAADYYPQAWQSYQYQGMCYGLPCALDVLALRCNEDLFQAQRLPVQTAMKTWAAYLKTSQELTGEPGDDGRPDVYGTATCPWWQLYVWQNGGDVVDDPLHPTRSTLSTPAAQEGLQFLADLSLKHHVAPPFEYTAGEGRLDLFTVGKVATIYVTRADLGAGMHKMSFMSSTVPIPQGKREANLGVGSGYCVPKAARHPEQGWRLAAFLAGLSGAQALSGNNLVTPAYKPLAEALQRTARATGVPDAFLESINVAHPVPYTPNYAAVEKAWQEGLQPLWTGQASVAEVARRLDDQVNKLLGEAQPASAWLGPVLPRG